MKDIKLKINKKSVIPKDNRGRPMKYPLFDLKIGESFFVKNTGKDNRVLQRRMSASMITRIKSKKIKH